MHLKVRSWSGRAEVVPHLEMSVLKTGELVVTRQVVDFHVHTDLVQVALNQVKFRHPIRIPGDTKNGERQFFASLSKDAVGTALEAGTLKKSNCLLRVIAVVVGPGQRVVVPAVVRRSNDGRLVRRRLVAEDPNVRH